MQSLATQLAEAKEELRKVNEGKKVNTQGLKNEIYEAVKSLILENYSAEKYRKYSSHPFLAFVDKNISKEGFLKKCVFDQKKISR